MKDDFEILRGLSNCVDKEQMVRYIESIQPKPMTNGDRIRNMTDLELAKFLCKWCNCVDGYCPGVKLCAPRFGKANGLVAWLKQPAEVEDG